MSYWDTGGAGITTTDVLALLEAFDGSGNIVSVGTIVTGSIPFSLVTGTVPIAQGGTGLTAAPSNGQLYIGNGTGMTLATLTSATGIAVTNASGSITLGTKGPILGTVPRTSVFVASTCNVSDSNVTITSSTLYGAPYPIPTTVTSLAISIWVVTGVASANGRLGIYYAATTAGGTPDPLGFMPGQLLLDAGAVTMTSSAAERTIVINQVLSPGLYFVALVGDTSTSVVRGCTNTKAQTGNYGASDSNTAAPGGYTATSTFGALPATFPTVASNAAAGPKITMKF